MLFQLTSSVTIILGYIGCLLAGLVVSNKERSSFKLGFYNVSSRLRVFFIFLVFGILLVMYMNFDTYKERIESSYLKLFFSLIPNTDELQEVQKKQLESFVEQTSDGFKSSITYQYNALPPNIRKQCKPMYDSIVSAIDAYKEEVIQNMRTEKYEIEKEGMKNLIREVFPAFEGIIKATPLITALLAFTFLEALRFFFGIIGGVLVFVLSKSKQML